MSSLSNICYLLLQMFICLGGIYLRLCCLKLTIYLSFIVADSFYRDYSGLRCLARLLMRGEEICRIIYGTKEVRCVGYLER